MYKLKGLASISGLGYQFLIPPITHTNYKYLIVGRYDESDNNIIKNLRMTTQ